MELVKSYDSEVDNDSDIEEIKVPSSMTKAPKKVDIINLDSDSEEESTVQKNNSKATDTNLISNPKRNIDCIDLGNGESSVNTSKESTPKKISEITPDGNEKKIDYLNLEDSDTDMECENNSNNVINLRESASTLSDIPVGPQKPSEVPESSKYATESLYREKELDNVQISSIVVDCNSPRNASDFSNYNISCDSAENSVSDPSRKHFKGDSNVVVNNAQGDPDNSEVEEKTYCIYREDDRIIQTKTDVLCRIPRQINKTLNAHTNVITSLNWCIPKFSYLFLSSSLDGSIKIWDLHSKKNPVRCFKSDYGISACKWSLDGFQIITGGKEKKACVFDVLRATKIVDYDIYNIVTSIEAHPYMEDVFLCGTRNAILGFDIRVNTKLPIRSYFSKCEEVLDIAFVDDNEFICSTNIVSQDSADRTIMAWHFSSGAKLSNQIYLERFTCPSLKVNPSDVSFIAQSNGNYIVSFSATRPYTRKKKRYIGHKVSGYGIECDISPDGKYVVSGDAEGSVYFYNYSNANVVFVTPCQQKIPINRVKWHPTFYSTVMTATYDGQIHIWK